jgi:hypothetical protein
MEKKTMNKFATEVTKVFMSDAKYINDHHVCSMYGHLMEQLKELDTKDNG